MRHLAASFGVSLFKDVNFIANFTDEVDVVCPLAIYILNFQIILQIMYILTFMKNPLKILQKMTKAADMISYIMLEVFILMLMLHKIILKNCRRGQSKALWRPSQILRQ